MQCLTSRREALGSIPSTTKIHTYINKGMNKYKPEKYNKKKTFKLGGV